MNYNFEERAKETTIVSKEKWEARKMHRDPVLPKLNQTHPNIKVYYPKEVQEILNLKTAMCPKCNKPCSSEHMISEHNIFVPKDQEILVMMKRIGIENKGKKRREIVREAAKAVKKYVQTLRVHLQRVKE